MEINLESININAFLDIDQEQYVEFKRNCLCGVFGENLDTGGSNASGKTSLINATVVAIFGVSAIGLTAKDVRNWYIDVAPRLQIKLSVDGKTFLIDRTIGGKLKAKLGDDEWLEGSSETIQNTIERIIGLTKDQFLAMTIKSQGDFGGFLLMKDSEKKNYLGSFLDLSEIETAEEKASTELRDLESRKLQIEKDIAQSAAGVDYNGMEIKELTYRLEESLGEKASAMLLNNEQSLSAAKQQLQILKSQPPHYEAKIKENREKVETEVASFESDKIQVALRIKTNEETIVSINEKITAYSPKLTELKGRVDDAKKAKNRFREMNDQLLQVQKMDSNFSQSIEDTTKDIEKFELELSSLNDKEDTHKDACYTCKRPLDWDSRNAVRGTVQAERDKIVAKINGKKALLDQYQTKKSSIQESLQSLSAMVTPANMSALDAEYESRSRDLTVLESGGLAELQKDVNLAKDIIRSDRSTLSLLDSQIRKTKEALESQIQSERRELEASIKNKQMEIEACETLKDHHNSKLADLKSKLARVQEQYDKLLSDAKRLGKELAEVNEKFAIASKSKALLSRTGFVGHLFDSILNDINNKTNANLKDLSITSNFTLHFSPDKIAKTSGGVSKSITYEIMSSGHSIGFNALSGAEKLSVILCVDEAVDEVLAKRAGVRVGWKFLDEQFQFVDVPNKEPIMEFLKNRSNKKSYVVVDHASEFNAAIENRIRVTKENGLARVTNG
jgi:DNA repair exonuclease SbcCD ATPase subunit